MSRTFSRRDEGWQHCPRDEDERAVLRTKTTTTFVGLLLKREERQLCTFERHFFLAFASTTAVGKTGRRIWHQQRAEGASLSNVQLLSAPIVMENVIEQDFVIPSESKDDTNSESKDQAMTVDLPQDVPALPGALPSETEMIAALLRHCCWVCGVTATNHDANVAHMLTHLQADETSPDRVPWTPGAAARGAALTTPGTPWGGSLARAATPRPHQDPGYLRDDALQLAKRPPVPGLLPLS
ncbi:hypothetical protein FOCC_FOCC014284, partial [Frankliniella occidentalis]